MQNQKPQKLKQLAAIIAKIKRTRAYRAHAHLTSKGGEIYAAGMSFQAVFAVFGALFVAFSLFGNWLLANPELLASLTSAVNDAVPALGGKDALDPAQILDTAALSWSGVIGIISILLVVVTWFSSTRTVIRLLNNLDAANESNALILKLRDLSMAGVFGVLVLAAGAFTLGAGAILDIAANVLDADSWVYNWAGWLLRHTAMFFIYWFVLFAIHKWLAALPYPAKTLWLGTLPGAIGLLVLTLLSSMLLSGATKNPLLASFAIIVGMLVWFNFVSRVLLFTSSWIAAGQDKTLGVAA